MMKPWLWLPPQTAHDLAQNLLPIYAQLFGSEKPNSFASVDWHSLHFPNPVGIAGGVDKTGKNLLAWQRLGAGFLEMGTITPLPQDANPGRIIDRNVREGSLWNKMGFPNSGADSALEQLKKIRTQIHIPLFINIGKNRNTPNETAGADYNILLNKFDSLADAFVVNISSPNTKGLRDLLKPESLKKFLQSIFADYTAKTPWLLKISPDISEAELYQILDVSGQMGCSGYILTNTLQNDQRHFKHDGGGVSGRLLKEKSEKLLSLAAEHLTRLGLGDRLIVSVGGIESAQDIARRLNMGAKLVQVYSALIFNGPGFFRSVAREQLWQLKERKDLSGSP